MGTGSSPARQLLAGMARKGLLVRLQRNKYVAESRLLESRFAAATGIVKPSYVSFWTIMNFYHFTEQVPAVIFVAASRPAKDVELPNERIKFVRMKPSRVFGYEKYKGGTIAEKEKGLVDSLLFPRYCGGISEVAKCLVHAWGEIGRKRLVEYALRIDNRSVVQRLGFLIGHFRLPLPKGLEEKLLKNRGRGFVKLDPAKGKALWYSRKWRVAVNIPYSSLEEWKAIV